MELKTPVCQVLLGGHGGRGLQDFLLGGILLFSSNRLSVFAFISDLMYFLLKVRKGRQEAVKLETCI